MKLSAVVLRQLVVRVDVTDYVRIVRRGHKDSPLGMGFGQTRFSSPKDAFRLLYLAQDTRTAIAETIIRDRFQDRSKRELLEDEFDNYSIAAIRKADPLNLVDLRFEGASLLGVSTDAVRAKAQRQGRILSQALYDRTALDGVVYMSRITNRECVAVYDRAVVKLAADAPALDLPRLGSLTADLKSLFITVIKSPA
jgi:hypothetical protein